MYLNALDNLSNLIFIGAYWVKDILWLRLLAMAGSLVLIPYYLFQKDPLWTPFVWSCVFITIHAIRAWGIMKERRPIAFSGDEQFCIRRHSERCHPNSSNAFWQSVSGKTWIAGMCSIPPAIRRIRLRWSSAAS